MITIGFVLQRYGKDVVGEAETLARNLAERLAQDGFRIVVFTTCARDSRTWENEFAAGESILRGVLIRRFPVLPEPGRLVDKSRSSSQASAAPVAGGDEPKWREAPGYSCPALIQALSAEQKTVNLFFFFTDLHGPAVNDIGAIDKPVILFPRIHEESTISRSAMQPVWQRPMVLFFLTRAEMELARRLFSPPGSMRLIRSGIDIHTDISEKNFRRKHLLFAPYLLYVGPVEKDRGLETVFDYYRALKIESYVDLVLIGKKRMTLPDIQGLKCLDQVSEADKLAALKGAVLSLQPSPLENDSITTLESFSVETPVLVNRRCQVLLEHIELCGGGLAYENEVDFLKGFRQIFRHPGLRKTVGAKGLEYVRQYYSWDAVLAEIKKGINEILAQ